MEKNYINNIIAKKASLINEFLKKTFLGIFNVNGIVSDYEMQRERKLSKKFDYDFTKDIKAALERGKNKKKLQKRCLQEGYFWYIIIYTTNKQKGKKL